MKMKEYERKICNVMDDARYYLISQFSKAYDEGYNDGKTDMPFTDMKEAEKKAYNRGLNDAWEAAKKLCQSVKYGGLEEYCSEIFGKKPFETFDVFDYTASEAIVKIKAYEDKQKQDYEIKVGDEVKSFFGERGIVITNEISTEGDSDISVLFKNRSHVQLYPKDKLTRTGRTFSQIARVLAEFRGEE